MTPLFHLIVCSALFLALAGFSAGNSPLELWRGVTPLPTGQPLYSAVSGQGIILMPGGGTTTLGVNGTNTLLISTNGTDWKVGPNTGTYGLHDVIFANGLWVAAASQGIATSPDGTNWTVRYVSSQKFLGVAYGNGRYVAVGQTFRTAVSTNGVDWSDLWGNAAGGKAITFAFGKFYMAANGSLQESIDGVSWTPVVVPSLNFPLAVDFVGGKLIASTSGDIFSTSDGVNWARASAGGAARSFTFGNGLYLAVGDGGLALTSVNASNWTQRSLGSFYFNGAAFINGQFIVSGIYGSVHTSTDGTNWTFLTTDVSHSTVRRIAHLNGQYVAVGDQATVMTSPDGQRWTGRAVLSGAHLRAVAYGNGLYLAGGGSDFIASTNGTNWAYNGNGFGINGLAHGRGMFVNVTDGSGGTQSRVQTSLYGTNWITRTNFAGATLMDVTFARGLFVAGCSDGRVATSTDGVFWTRRTFDTNAFTGLTRVIYGNGRFHVLGSTRLAFSEDGTNWASIALPLMVSPQSIAAGDGYVAILDTQLRLWNSRDLISWTNVRLRTSFPQYDVVHGPGQFLIGGAPGQIWQSAPRIELVASRQGLWVNGPPGMQCEILRNDALKTTNWVSFGSVTISNGPTLWSNPQLTSPTGAIYRATVRFE